MSLVTANQFQLVPDVNKAVGEGLANAGTINQFMQKSRENDRNAQIRELLGQVQAGGEKGMAAREQFAQNFPEEFQAFEAKNIKLARERHAASSEREKARTVDNATLFAELKSIPTKEGRMTHLLHKKQRNAESGLDSNETNRLIESLQNMSDEAFEAQLDSGLKVGQILGILQAPQTSETTQKIREETRSQVRKEVGGIAKETSVVKTNWTKLNNLASEIKKGNRQAVPQALVAIVKLGDPGSIVSTNEMRGAINQEDPIAAVFNLLTNKGVDSNLAESIASKIDPLNPENINVEDLLATGRASVSAFVPNLQGRLESAEETARKNLTDEGINALFSEKMRKEVASLSDLIGGISKEIPAVNTKGWKLHEDANGNKAYVGPNGEIEEVQ